MYKVGGYVVVPDTKSIKVIEEIEMFGEDYVFYFTDGTSEGMNNCLTVDQAFEMEQ
jgi:hypothetical protein